MKFVIYHKKVLAYGFAKAPKAFAMEDYNKVADVESDNLGDTFRITNHIATDWTKNPEVTKLYIEKGCRSTSVGDVVEDEDGKFHFCAPCGWFDILRSES